MSSMTKIFTPMNSATKALQMKNPARTGSAMGTWQLARVVGHNKSDPQFASYREFMSRLVRPC